MLGQAFLGQDQTLTDHADFEQGELDRPTRGFCQREHALGTQVIRIQRPKKAVNTVEGQRNLDRYDPTLSRA